MSSIFKKLVQFQAICEGVTLDSSNPHFKSKFCSLGNLSNTVMPLLSSVGLCFCHLTSQDDNKVQVETRVIDQDTERYLSSKLTFDTNTNPQKVGALLTYYKRYQLAGLLGIAEMTDDDGESHRKDIPQEKPDLISLDKFESGIDWFVGKIQSKEKTVDEFKAWFASKKAGIATLNEVDQKKVNGCYKDNLELVMEKHATPENKLEMNI